MTFSVYPRGDGSTTKQYCVLHKTANTPGRALPFAFGFSAPITSLTSIRRSLYVFLRRFFLLVFFSFWLLTCRLCPYPFACFSRVSLDGGFYTHNKRGTVSARGCLFFLLLLQLLVLTSNGDDYFANWVYDAKPVKQAPVNKVCMYMCRLLQSLYKGVVAG